MIHKKTFLSGELNESFQLVYTHNLGTQELIARWYDENMIERSTFDLFQIVDDNNVILSCNEEISGTHTLLLSYQAAGESSSGRRLFELSTTNDPAESLRIALGKASTPAINMTLEDLLEWLYNELGFLKASSNLSDLSSVALARAALAVYSSSQVDSYLAQKATLYQSGSGAVLGVANTSIYNPTSNYHPATFRNIKNTGRKLLLAGSVAVDGSWSGDLNFVNTDVLDVDDIEVEMVSSGRYKVTHNLGSSSYFVGGVVTGSTSAYNNECVSMITKANDYFELYTTEGASLSPAAFDFEMYQYYTYQPDE